MWHNASVVSWKWVDAARRTSGRHAPSATAGSRSETDTVRPGPRAAGGGLGGPPRTLSNWLYEERGASVHRASRCRPRHPVNSARTGLQARGRVRAAHSRPTRSTSFGGCWAMAPAAGAFQGAQVSRADPRMPARRKRVQRCGPPEPAGLPRGDRAGRRRWAKHRGSSGRPPVHRPAVSRRSARFSSRRPRRAVPRQADDKFRPSPFHERDHVTHSVDTHHARFRAQGPRS